MLTASEGTAKPGLLGRVFYGWWIVLGGAVVMAMSAGINFYGFSAFFVPLNEEFGWSRGVLSGVFSLSRLEGGFFGPAGGLLVDKLGPRRMMLFGIPLMGLGFLILSRINSLITLYLVYIFIITLGSSIGTFSPVGAAVANWFNKRRSRAIGLVMSGVAVGGSIFLPLLGWVISSYGWRTASVTAGLIIIAAGTPMALLMRHKPEQYGLLPDGERSGGHTQSADDAEEEPVAEISISAKQSLKTRAFWLIGFSNSFRSLVTTGLTIHFVAMMIDRGFSLTTASSLLGSVALLSIVGRIGLAWLGDIVDKRYLLAGAMGMMALSLLGMSQAGSFWVLAIFLVLYAVAYGGSIVLPVALQAEYFGRHSFATIRGLMQSVQTAGMLIGPVFAGFVYDATQSYFAAFLGFALAGLVAGLLLLGVRKPKAQALTPVMAR